MADAAGDQLGDRPRVGQEERDTHRRVVGVDAVVGMADVEQVEVTRRDVEVDGQPLLLADAHIGSQKRSVSWGRPKYDGSWVKTMPLWPFAEQRSISANVSSRSQNGNPVTGM